MDLFKVVPEDFFKVLTSKNKVIYVECLQLVYETCKKEWSFGVDKEELLYKLETYFDNETMQMVFDEDDIETATDSRAKANAILRRLKDSGWIEYELSRDFKYRVNLYDYAVTVIESFNKIVKNEEIEYQSLVSQIYVTLSNEDFYKSPYEFMIKRVIENTQELIGGLKKLNANIKKHIDSITNDKSAGEIVKDFFFYHKDVETKAYHRIKTSDNISHFRREIRGKLEYILGDEQIFAKAVNGYMEVEEISDELEAKSLLRGKILEVKNTFDTYYDEIIKEIDNKHSRYLNRSVDRAKFLLNNTNNAEGKILKILGYLADEFNKDETLSLNDELDNEMAEIFSIFPQGYLDNDSLYVIPISKKMSVPEPLKCDIGISDEKRALRKQLMYEQSKNRFSSKNINAYVNKLLEGHKRLLASTLPIESKRDLIKLIFISLYGRDSKSTYKVLPIENTVVINNYRFRDFIIERRD